MQDLFLKIAGSQANNKGENFVAGKGVVLIEELICKKFFEGNTFVARTKVISSENKGDRIRKTKDENPGTGDLIPPNQPGTRPGWPQKLDKHASAPGNVKAFVLALLGFKESEVSSQQFGEALEQLLDKSQPGRGFLIRYETYDQQTRSGANVGRWNTYVRWSHVGPEEGNSKDEIAKRRAELDKSAPITQ